MKIHYHRIAGRIGMSDQETGDRGAWLEKRRALWACLQQRGHEVICISRPTKPSARLWEAPIVPGADGDGFGLGKPLGKADLLMIEFGGTNGLFFGEDVKRSFRIMELHAGPIAFICDDPDLFFPWKKLPNEDWSRWSMLVNATGKEFGQPEGVRVLDMPYSSLQPSIPIASAYGEHFVYSGRPAGRKAAVERFITHPESGVQVYGRAEEWDECGVDVAGGSPKQAERAMFYNGKLGCLGLADSKHKRLGWRTGRIYHAAHSGCPAVVEADNNKLTGFPRVATFEELEEIRQAWLTPRKRKDAYHSQLSALDQESQILNQTLEALKL